MIFRDLYYKQGTTIPSELQHGPSAKREDEYQAWFTPIVAGSKQTIMPSEIGAAIGDVYSGDLAKYALKNAAEACKNYERETHTLPEMMTMMNASEESGLQFPVVPSGRLLACATARPVSIQAAVFFAAALEHISAEILELSGNAACGFGSLGICTLALQRRDFQLKSFSIQPLSTNHSPPIIAITHTFSLHHMPFSP